MTDATTANFSTQRGPSHHLLLVLVGFVPPAVGPLMMVHVGNVVWSL